MLTFGPDISKVCESIPFPPKLTKDNKIITRSSQITITMTPGVFHRCGCCIHDGGNDRFSMFHNFTAFHNFTGFTFFFSMFSQFSRFSQFYDQISRCPELSGLPDCSAHRCKKKLPLPKEKVCLLVTYPFWCVSSCVKTVGPVSTVSLVSHASPVSHAGAKKILWFPA